VKRTELRRSNPTRARKRERENFGDRAPIVRAMPCLAASSNTCAGEIHAAHAKSRGAGGNRRHLIPLCQFHHHEQHQHGVRTFEAAHGLDLLAAADTLARELDARGIA